MNDYLPSPAIHEVATGLASIMTVDYVTQEGGLFLGHSHDLIESLVAVKRQESKEYPVEYKGVRIKRRDLRIEDALAAEPFGVTLKTDLWLAQQIKVVSRGEDTPHDGEMIAGAIGHFWQSPAEEWLTDDKNVDEPGILGNFTSELARRTKLLNDIETLGAAAVLHELRSNIPKISVRIPQDEGPGLMATYPSRDLLGYYQNYSQHGRVPGKIAYPTGQIAYNLTRLEP